MGAPSMPSTESVPTPAPVQRVDADVVKARNTAKNDAAKKYGLAGTDVTKGALSESTASTSQKKLGG